VLRLYPRLAASLEESPQPLVPESADHERKCNLVRYGLQEAERNVNSLNGPVEAGIR